MQSIEEFRPTLTDVQFRTTLSAAVGNPTDERLTAVVERYRIEPAWRLLGFRSGGVLVGIVGFELRGAGHAGIRHIAVAPDHRGRGIGRALIQRGIAVFSLTHLAAETDHEAVDFYRKVGFTVRSLGERFPGVERFRCTYEVAGARE